MMLTLCYVVLALKLNSAGSQSAARTPRENVAIIFPGQTTPVPQNSTPSPKLDTREKDRMNRIRNIKDFAKFFGVDLPEEPSSNFTIRTRIGTPPPEPIELDHAVCSLENQTVSLNVTDTRDVTYFPTCVRVPRCSGCCLSPERSCNPIRKETLNVKVFVIRENIKRLRRTPKRNLEREFITRQVDKHLECGCTCRLKESECDPKLHTYDEIGCECLCPNSEEMYECFESNLHYWDNDKCKCHCRNPRPCSTGLTFDLKTCSCVGPEIVDEFYKDYY